MDRWDVSGAVVHPPDRCYAWENEAGAELVLAAAARHCGRLIPAVTVNPWRPDALAVVRDACERGGRMLTFSPSVQGFILSGDRLDPILEWLSERHAPAPVYVHTGGHSNATPCQLALLAKRFPGLTFIMGHCGATDYATDVAPACQYASNIRLEASSARPPGFVKRPDRVGPERCIMGSGWPYNRLGFEWSEVRRLLPEELHQAVLGANLAALLGESDDR